MGKTVPEDSAKDRSEECERDVLRVRVSGYRAGQTPWSGYPLLRAHRPHYDSVCHAGDSGRGLGVLQNSSGSGRNPDRSPGYPGIVWTPQYMWTRVCRYMWCDAFSGTRYVFLNHALT